MRQMQIVPAQHVVERATGALLRQKSLHGLGQRRQGLVFVLSDKASQQCHLCHNAGCLSLCHRRVPSHRGKAALIDGHKDQDLPHHLA